METAIQDYTATITVNNTPTEAFNAINHIAGWWTQSVEGSSTQLNESFTVRFGETFITLKITELVPGKKISWLVTDCYKHWLQHNKKEWLNTSIHWQISTEGKSTSINFTHVGLLPGKECYDGCENAWNGYIKGSLYKLLTEGKGRPELK
ncbi:SRPBCC family protein [Ferruginibacter sp.]